MWNSETARLQTIIFIEKLVKLLTVTICLTFPSKDLDFSIFMEEGLLE